MKQLLLPLDNDFSIDSMLSQVCYDLDNPCKNQCDIDEDYLRIALNLITQLMNLNENLFAKGRLWELCLGSAIGAQLKNSSRSHIGGSTSFDLVDNNGTKIELKTSSQLIQKGTRFFKHIETGTQNSEKGWSTILFKSSRDNEQLWYCKERPVQILNCARETIFEPFMLGPIVVLNGNSPNQKHQHIGVLKEYLSSIGFDNIYFVKTPKDYSDGSHEITIYKIKKQDFINKSFFRIANNNITCKIIYNPDYVKTLYSSRICNIKEPVSEDKTKFIVNAFLEKIGFNMDFIPKLF